MDGFVYVATSGTEQIMRAQTVVLNNLANSHVAGFKADMAQFSSESVSGSGYESRVYSTPLPDQVDYKPGDIITTNRELDIAIRDRGWLAVQSANGKEAYTRAGNLQRSPEGLLTTLKGDLVLGDGGPISIPPAAKIVIGDDGTVSVQPQGQSGETTAQVGRIKLVDPPLDKLKKDIDGLFYHIDGEAVQADSSVKVVAGALEQSNVSAIGSLVEMMELSRAYEIQVNLMKAAEDMADSSSQVVDVT